MTVPDKSEGYLSGQLLVATPQIRGSCFERSVVYLCAHNEEGAMGIIVNHVIRNLGTDEVLRQFGIHAPDDMTRLPIYFGGPVDSLRGFVLHSVDYSTEHTLQTPGGIGLTSSVGILEDLVEGRGPRDCMLALGYAGWSAQQLENEMEDNAWFTVPATREIIFGHDNETKWIRSASSVGVDPFMLSDTAGHA